MDEKESSLSPHKSGIYTNLLMPGFTDAGAGTSYVPEKVIPRRTEAASIAADITTGTGSSNAADADALDDEGDDYCHDVCSPSEDTFSEAATEVHDNRTSGNAIHSTTNRDRYYNIKSSIIQNNGLSGRGRVNSVKDIANKTHNNNGIDQPNHNSSHNDIEVEATFGFFPSTKPPLSPSLHGIGGASNGGEYKVDKNEKITKTPKSSTKITSTSLSPCPQPISPPPVTRKQLVSAKQPPSTAIVMGDVIQLPSAVPTRATAKTLPTSSRDPSKSESDNGINRNNYYQIGKTFHDPLQPGSGIEGQKNEIKARTERDRAETRHHQRPLCERPFAISKTMKREVSNVSLAPETGAVVNMEMNLTKLKQEEEREDRNDSRSRLEPKKLTKHHNQSRSKNEKMEERPNDSNLTDNDTKLSDYDGGRSRRLDLKALQEIENMASQKPTKTLQSFGIMNHIGNTNKAKSQKVVGEEVKLADMNKEREDFDDERSEELPTSSSMVSSTCSEFGTVIEMGGAAMAARIKEVEEMESAALAFETMEDSNNVSETKTSQLSSSSLLQHDASLDLPILELPSSGRIDTMPTKTSKMQAGQSDTKTTVATANSTINPRKRNLTKSEMISAAFRRIGPIHSLNNNNVRGDKNIRNSISAPTTPMRLTARKDAKRMPGASIIDRESSPTRYETASDIAGNQKNRILSPRLSSLLRGRSNTVGTSSISIMQSTNQPKAASHSTPLSPRMTIASTLQYAQNCFSQKNTLTEYPVDGYDYDTNDIKRENGIDQRHRNVKEDLVIPPLGQRQKISRLAPRVLPLESSAVRNNRTLRHSNSLDNSCSKRSPFRELPSYSTQRRRFLNHSFPAPTNQALCMAFPDPELTDITLTGPYFSPTDLFSKSLALKSTLELRQPQRVDIEREDALDILACLVEQGIADWNASNINDKSSTNVYNDGDTNKVEKSTNTDNDSITEVISSPYASPLPSTSTGMLRTKKEEETGQNTSLFTTAANQKADFNDVNHDHYDYDSESALHDLIEDFKKWAEDHDEDNNPNGHDEKKHQRQRRTEILQDLVRSCAYAVEMKRASASAYSWLKSIGRGQNSRKAEILGDNEQMGNDERIRKAANNIGKNGVSAINKMEVVTMQATLHRAQLELTATKEMNLMLNEELSQCRAEIGRMKSISRSDTLNKSIFDDIERSSDTSSSEARPKDLSADKNSRSPEEDLPEYVSKTDPECEKFFQGVSPEEARARINSTGESDVIVLKNALQKANETIRKLHGDLCEKNVLEDGEETDPAPVVDIRDIQSNLNRALSKASTPDSTRRTVNVQMLDGENFVTDWNELRDLPPPPDHSLQSPIVSTVLEQWTEDRSLHEALLSWINNVMKGDDLEKLPPLTISSLDHQVRDGFTMHVLPHLLRRADIHVAVQTRTHRQTTYDMSVTVRQKKDYTTQLSEVISTSTENLLSKDIKSQQQPSLLDRRDSLSGDEWVNRFEPRSSSTESVAHSAVTDTIANLPATPPNPRGITSDLLDRPPPTPVRTEYSEFSSQLRSRSGSADTLDESSQLYKQRHNESNQGVTSSGTIMGALGGALSGLLSRNKYAISPGRFHPSQQSLYRPVGSGQDNRDSSNILPASLRAQMDLTSSPTPGTTGHHRVGQLEANISGAVSDEYQYHQGEPHPYHRVVSAPPGRIGVTFVEFRGHAMVSDVATDSPLAGWVFPSDILIAVDEIPVSGMRVRDIVTILSDRKNRQRAMRVISSHAMNEFTMMNQVGGPLNGEIDECE